MRKISFETAKQLIKAHEAREYWDTARKFAREHYGADAHKVVISVRSEYNDSHYDDRIDEIRVYGKNNKQLYLDPKLPAVVKKIAKVKEWYKNASDEDVMNEVENEIKYDLEVPLGREDHGDEDFSETYTFYVDGAKPKEPRFFLADEDE
jgi:hypothetical protein